MVKDESGDTSPWLRASKWLRISAWLPPGLALGWLAALVTLIHSVGLAVAAWGATVSVVLLLVLLVGQLQKARTQKPSIGKQTPAGADESEQPGVASAAASAETAETLPPLATTDAVLGPAHAFIASTVISSSVSGLQVLTVEEVASVLRVDTKSVITSISNGELPGKKIGSDWRVDLGALTRWLQGPYSRT